MKKKIVIFIIITIIIVLGAVIFSITKTDDINKKAYILFGNDYCPKKSDDFYYEDYEHPRVAGQAFTDYKCKLCNEKYRNPNTATPKICPTCATSTNRCAYCGKLENEN